MVNVRNRELHFAHHFPPPPCFYVSGSFIYITHGHLYACRLHISHGGELGLGARPASTIPPSKHSSECVGVVRGCRSAAQNPSLTQNHCSSQLPTSGPCQPSTSSLGSIFSSWWCWTVPKTGEPKAWIPSGISIKPVKSLSGTGAGVTHTEILQANDVQYVTIAFINHGMSISRGLISAALQLMFGWWQNPWGVCF